MVHAFTWAVPAATILLYIASEDGSLSSLAGLDTLSLFFVETVMRDISFIIHVGTVLYLWAIFFFDGFSALEFWIAFFYTWVSFGLEYPAWVFGV